MGTFVSRTGKAFVTVPLKRKDRGNAQPSPAKAASMLKAAARKGSAQKLTTRKKS